MAMWKFDTYHRADELKRHYYFGVTILKNIEIVNEDNHTLEHFPIGSFFGLITLKDNGEIWISGYIAMMDSTAEETVLAKFIRKSNDETVFKDVLGHAGQNTYLHQ